jgi:CubicO group peptidase (beta-lactamase class C family)
MRAPIKFSENSNPVGKQAIFYYTPHLERHLLKLKLIKNAKKTYEYRSASTALIGLVLKRALKAETLTQYLQRKIWDPLGMESDAKWLIDNNEGFEKSWCCLAGTARDFLKIANLYVQNGKWFNKQVVSETWIRKTLEPLSESDKNMIYSYNWWLYPSNKTFAAIGKDGQFAYIKPSEKLVIIRMGYNKGTLARTGWFDLFNDISRKIFR